MKIWVTIVLCCMISFSQPTRGARILGLFALQAKSHFIMYQEVMKSLADAGHQVDVVSHFPQKKPYPNYTDLINLEGTSVALMNNVSYEYLPAMTSIVSMKAAIDMVGTDVCNLMELPELQKLIKNPPSNPPYDLVITEVRCVAC